MLGLNMSEVTLNPYILNTNHLKTEALTFQAFFPELITILCPAQG